MREVNIGTKKYSKVVCLDEPALESRACHEYYFCRAKDRDDVLAGEFGHVQFQNGPVKENGVNGCHQEDLLIIVIDRLEHFQRGDFACKENDYALQKIREALVCLRDRTNTRVERGVEGTNQV